MLNSNEACPFNQYNCENFDNVYNEFHPLIKYFSWSLLNDEAAAEDITQNTFCKLLDCTENFNGKQNIKNYLYRITRNACYDELRKKQPQQNLHKHLMQEQDAENPQAILAWEEAETFNELEKAVQMLEPRQALVTKLSYWEQKTNEEIAAIMQTSVRTVRRLKLLAVKKLRVLVSNNHLSIIIFALLVSSAI